MERKMYFETPTQVFFYEGRYRTGIAYRDEIICGCCGDIYSIKEIYEWADEDGLMNPIEELSWVNISDEIQGDINYPVPIFKMESEFDYIDFNALSSEIFKDKPF